MNTLQAIDFLDAEAAKATEFAANIISIGRDAAEFQQRAERLHECRLKLIALNEILADLKLPVDTHCKRHEHLLRDRG